MTHDIGLHSIARLSYILFKWVIAMPYRETFDKYIVSGYLARQCMTLKNNISIRSLVLIRPTSRFGPQCWSSLIVSWNLIMDTGTQGLLSVLLFYYGNCMLFAEYLVDRDRATCAPTHTTES